MMEWHCTHCDEEDIPSRLKHCPGCGTGRHCDVCLETVNVSLEEVDFWLEDRNMLEAVCKPCRDAIETHGCDVCHEPDTLEAEIPSYRPQEMGLDWEEDQVCHECFIANGGLLDVLAAI